MSKSLTKLWLRGLRRLVASQVEPLRVPKSRPSTKPARPKSVKTKLKSGAATRAATVRSGSGVGAQPTARESRVRPRASAWALGKWMRSYHSAPPTGGRFVNHVSYALYTPPQAELERAPLVVMLHGCQQNADDFAQGTRLNLLADKFGFAVLYPEQSKHDHAHRCWRWYDASGNGGGGEAASIVSLVKAVVAEHGFDAERVYLAGMSAGAGMSALLAVRYPQLFAAVGLHSGVVFGEASSAIGAMDVMRRGSRNDPVTLVDAAVDTREYPGMPAIIVHGELDSVVSPSNAEQLTQQFLRLNGFVDAAGAPRAGELREEKQADGVVRDYFKNGRRVVKSVVVRGLGHAWAGGDDTVAFHSAKGPDSSAVMWEFFKHQRRSSESAHAAFVA
ncbi:MULTISPECIES: PHB depolymerase family esterase [unclassified Caballeronia]|uniref:extracellular catalytic domain type 1 short-chain-length polyhydroxyalkanoate depolymerase n=1 Tax=unclassified Caballeronia TaxID=2646786 RepID=UPI002863C978|nr:MULTISPECIES: PHB depolymerase family esterase [unclassified Caballeronia]MDR5776001.1 PHB depolymerase family esterase [Caballeronia sp. LZ002]MDR5851441.1 PHB depolymerase family esterase [Caballeronia sp. LZ003]